MLVKVNGLVIRSIKYRETSLIFDMYTEQYGLASFIVNGARKPRSRLPASLFQLTNWLEIVAYVKDPRSLNRVKEAQLILPYHDIPFDLHKSSIALFMTEVTQKTIRENEANKGLYHFIFDTYRHLDQTTGPVRDLHLIFLLKLTQHLGFTPHNNCSTTHPYFHLISGDFVSQDHPVYTLGRDISATMRAYLDHMNTGVSLPDPDRQTRKHLLEGILNFYRYHLDKLSEIKTHKILSEVFM